MARRCSGFEKFAALASLAGLPYIYYIIYINIYIYIYVCIYICIYIYIRQQPHSGVQRDGSIIRNGMIHRPCGRKYRRAIRRGLRIRYRTSGPWGMLARGRSGGGAAAFGLRDARCPRIARRSVHDVLCKLYTSVYQSDSASTPLPSPRSQVCQPHTGIQRDCSIIRNGMISRPYRWAIQSSGMG